MSAPAAVELVTPAEAALYFRVDAKTVTRWAKEGKLLTIRTPGGARRYFGSEVRARLAGQSPAAARKLALADLEVLTGEPAA